MKMKKLLCSFLALAMVFTMTTVSFANPDEATVVTTLEELQTAIDAGEDVKLGADITYSGVYNAGKTIKVPTSRAAAAVDVTLDLNGYTLAQTTTTSGGLSSAAIAIRPGSTLTITDSATDGKISACNCAFQNEGTLNIEGGSIVIGESVSGADISDDMGFAYGVWMYMASESAPAPAVYMTGGSISMVDNGIASDYVSAVCVNEGVDGVADCYKDVVINITGGEIEGNVFVHTDTTNVTVPSGTEVIYYNKYAGAYADAISTNIDSHGTLSVDGDTVTLKATGTIGWLKNPGGKYGNWVGFKVTAPAGIDAANVTILRSDNATRNLDAIKDGKDANGNVYAHMYVNVANGEGTYIYKFDWTSDGVYDLTLVIDATEATLTPDPTSIFGSLVFISNMDTVTEDDAIYYPLLAVTAINSLNYSEVGFTFKAVRSGNEPAEVTKTEKTSQVYSTLNVTQSDGTTEVYDEEDMGQKYLFGKALWFNTEDWSNDNTTLYITPFAIGKDGKTIYGSETKITNEILNARGTQLFKEVAVNE